MASPKNLNHPPYAFHEEGRDSNKGKKNAYTKPDRELCDPVRRVSNFQKEPRIREQRKRLGANNTKTGITITNLKSWKPFARCWEKVKNTSKPSSLGGGGGKPCRESTSARASAAARFTVSKQLQICAKKCVYKKSLHEGKEGRFQYLRHDEALQFVNERIR